MVTEKIEETIKKYNLIEENDIVVVAVSGGPDSMCLLDNLIKLKDKLKIKELVVAHLNHMIRQEAKSETEYVEKFCKDNNIKCYTKFVKVEEIAKNQKIGTEEAGRNARYEFFDEVMKETNANKIAIAHNKKDNCETVLMHLMRGSGLSGLSGIKPYSNGKYIRPLINCSREEIENYCKEQNLDPKFDKTNEDNDYTRNRIRNELIPYIEKNFNPNIIETVNRLSQVIDETESYMEKQTKITFCEILELKEENQIALNLKKFNHQEKIIKSRLILQAVKELFGTTKGIEKIHIEDIIKLCGNNIGGKFLTPNKNLKVLVKEKKVYFIKL
mgnify:FL=1